jgi:hypothetical protein
MIDLNIVYAFTETAHWLFFALILNIRQKYLRCEGEGINGK